MLYPIELLALRDFFYSTANGLEWQAISCGALVLLRFGPTNSFTSGSDKFPKATFRNEAALVNISGFQVI